VLRDEVVETLHEISAGGVFENRGESGSAFPLAVTNDHDRSVAGPVKLDLLVAVDRRFVPFIIGDAIIIMPPSLCHHHNHRCGVTPNPTFTDALTDR